MPTVEKWLNDSIAQTTWRAPLTPSELQRSFRALAAMITERDHPVHVLFDITESGLVPAQAPVLALRSRFLTRPNTGHVVVVGMDVIPQVLAKVATSMTNKDIVFFPLREAALHYLDEVEAASGT